MLKRFSIWMVSSSFQSFQVAYSSDSYLNKTKPDARIDPLERSGIIIKNTLNWSSHIFILPKTIQEFPGPIGHSAETPSEKNQNLSFRLPAFSPVPTYIIPATEKITRKPSVISHVCFMPPKFFSKWCGLHLHKCETIYIEDTFRSPSSYERGSIRVLPSCSDMFHLSFCTSSS